MGIMNRGMVCGLSVLVWVCVCVCVCVCVWVCVFMQSGWETAFFRPVCVCVCVPVHICVFVFVPVCVCVCVCGERFSPAGGVAPAILRNIIPILHLCHLTQSLIRPGHQWINNLSTTQVTMLHQCGKMKAFTMISILTSL